MTTQRNVAASVRARLLRMAQQRGDDFQFLLSRYANERLLYRLAVSSHAEQFILKGATLFTVWSGAPHRATRDIDLLGFGEPTLERIRAVVAEWISLDVEDDGVVFDPETIDVGPIRADQEYSGVRAILFGRIAGARVRCQVDVGFGDAVTPAPVIAELPALLEFPPPRLRMYPRETVVAEKVEAAVQLGMANSRMKDFYDLMVLSRSFSFDGPLLVQAVRATFERRGTQLPESTPVAFTSEFAGDPSKQQQWAAFVRKASAADAGSLPQAIVTVEEFAGPVLNATTADEVTIAAWPPGGPWQAA